MLLLWMVCECIPRNDIEMDSMLAVFAIAIDSTDPALSNAVSTVIVFHHQQYNDFPFQLSCTLVYSYISLIFIAAIVCQRQQIDGLHAVLLWLNADISCIIITYLSKTVLQHLFSTTYLMP